MRKIIIAFLTLAILITNITAYAGSEIGTSVDSDNRLITVSGDLGEGNALRRVVITVLPKGATEEALALVTPDNLKDSVLGMYMAHTDADGKYSVSFKLEAEAGEYTAVLSGPEKGDIFSAIFFNPDSVESIISMLEAARKSKDAAKIKEILDVEDTFRSLGMGKHSDEIYHVKYTDLTSSQFAFLANCDKEYKNAADFNERYYEGCVIKAFNSMEAADELITLIEDCDDVLKITGTDSYKVYTALDNKTPVDNDMKKGGFATIDEIKERFAESAHLNSLSSMQNWSEFKEFVADNNDYLGLDLTQYKSLKTPSAVDKALAGKSFSSINAFKEAFKKAVSDEAKAENASVNTNTSSGGGGGGGGGGRTTVTKPLGLPQTITTDPTDTENQSQTQKTPAFNDLDSVPWAKEAIEWLAEKKILNGKAEGKFFPNDILTREECAKILVVAFNEEDPEAECDFTDLDSSHWSYPYVAAAKKAGIINGYEDGSFGVGKGVSRQDFAVMIYRIALAKGIRLEVKRETEFSDADSIADYAVEAVGVLSAAGIINGKGDGIFAPEAKCTRAEAAKILYSVMTGK